MVQVASLVELSGKIKQDFYSILRRIVKLNKIFSTIVNIHKFSKHELLIILKSLNFHSDHPLIYIQSILSGLLFFIIMFLAKMKKIICAIF